MTRTLRIASAGVLLASVAGAQQFTIDQTLPGGDVWSEGLEAADVDNDGDLDMFVADGEGFSSPGPKRQNRLHINELVETASLGFTDESLARLGAHVSHARQVVTGDLDADGFIDALFANGFNSELPFLYMNQGASSPGFFDFDGVARGFTQIHNSADAAMGDVDNDGDLDVVVLDAGASLIGGGAASADVPRIYINDGTANFVEDAGALPGVPNKGGQQDVYLVDIDNDWDLDIWGANHINNHYLLLNDGTGTFSDASGLIPSTSANVYEADCADLDGDTDMDMFFISLGGFNEGPLENDLLPSGPLGFTKGASASGNDDNEISFCDYDNDGDLDAFIGSLSGNTEKIRRNDGGMIFVGDSTAIQNFSDATLDITHADLDNDGDYDLITGQGESNQSNWDNKVYLNSGPADTTAPVVQRVESLGDCQDTAGSWVVRAQIQDSVMDDSKDWLSAQAIYDVDGNGGTVAGVHTGVGMYRFEMTDTADGLGEELTFQIEVTDWAGNTTLTSPEVVCLCGYGSYGLSGLPFVHALTLTGGGSPQVGGNVALTVTGVPLAASAVVGLVSLGDADLPGFLGGNLYVDAFQLIDPVLLAVPAGGTANLGAPIPNLPALGGLQVYFQSISDDDGAPFFNRLSNGLKLTICP